MPRLTKAQTEIVDNFGFRFEAVPSKELTRVSKYDDLWTSARELLMAHPGQSVMVREYNQASAAYMDAAAINNGEHRSFKENGAWAAIAVVNHDRKVTGPRTGKTTYGYDLYLTYTGK